MRDFSASGTHSRRGNGAFIHSCHTHCEAQRDPDWPAIAIGGVSMREALGRWWRADEGAPAAEHTFLPCMYSAASPHQCNPTCMAGP